MHLTPSDPDISTLYRKIRQGRLDLQPNFQRGEVWGKLKKQRLIDSILRGWHIPPIHVIQVPKEGRQEVLDGQQRLAAIRDFISGEFPIHGFQEPMEEEIKKLDGLYWNDLSDSERGRIEDFTVRLLTISDYKPGEPGELFFRLNQPTNLTSAEQRNAYFGEARQQVKNLSEYMIEAGYSTESIGFSNSRMAYDDVIAKCLLTLEQQTLSKKITANTVTTRYRESTGFKENLIDSIEISIDILIQSIFQRKTRTRLNKATLYSWFIFLCRYNSIYSDEEEIMNEFFDKFETIKERNNDLDSPELVPKGLTKKFVIDLINIFLDRASSRVSDISSVKLRDLVIWSFFVSFFRKQASENPVNSALLSHLHYLNSVKKGNLLENELLTILSEIMQERIS